MTDHLVGMAAETAASIQTIGWLSRVGIGRLDNDEIKNIVVVDRSMALQLIVGDAWLDYRMEAQNDITNSLVIGFHDDAYSKWNAVIDELDARYLDNIKPRLRQECQAEFGLQGEKVAEVIKHIVRMACLEAAYREFVSRFHFTQMLRWLANGRLPCGATGKFPSPGLLIY